VAHGGSVGRNVWGETTLRTVTGEQTGGAYTLLELQLPIGWRRTAYVHHALDECFIVLAGAVRFEIEDRSEPVVAAPGDTVYVPRGLSRAAELADERPATVLVVETPAPTGDETSGWLDGIELLASDNHRN
jgi:mannose-6-phosphate isomerase-like protein (cupin superfamily)